MLEVVAVHLAKMKLSVLLFSTDDWYSFSFKI